MRQAARAIIIENNRLLLMRRDKHGDEYYTLVGGRLNEGETPEGGLRREIKEETGLDIISAKLVFIEQHPPPYNDQSIYLCEVAPHGEAQIQPGAEEHLMNKIELNIHQPDWVEISAFKGLAFRTPQLKSAILKGLNDGWPDQPLKL